jgi:hypothetical protein
LLVLPVQGFFALQPVIRFFDLFIEVFGFLQILVNLFLGVLGTFIQTFIYLLP